MKTILIIQARTSSTRLPRKMFAEICGMPMFEFIYRRCQRANVDQVVLATSDDPSDDELATAVTGKGFEFFRGSLNDVRKRFLDCAHYYEAGIIVRLCGDSPLVDIELMNRIIQLRENKGLDLVAPKRGTFIPAFDSEVLTVEALQRSVGLCNEPEAKEHVTIFIRENSELFKCEFPEAGLLPENLKDLHLTVDYEEYLKLNRRILEMLPKDQVADFSFTSEMVLKVLENNPELLTG